MGMKIFMAVCFLPCLFIMYGYLYWNGKQRGNLLLGVTLWQGATEEKEVQDIIKRFKKEMHLLLVISLLLFGMTCFANRDSILVSTQMIWLIFVILIFFFPIGWGNRRLKAVKREYLVRMGELPEVEQHKVYVDLKAATQPKKKPFLLSSLVGVIGSVIPIVIELFFASKSFYGWWTEGLLIIMFLTNVFCFWMQYYFGYTKTDVVSSRSEINIQLSRVRQYQWSRFFSILIWCNVIFTLVLWYGMHHPGDLFLIVIGAGLIYLFVSAVAAFVADKKIRKVYQKYRDEADLQMDEDDNWVWGMFYYNKTDQRHLVNYRVGTGVTFNMAKKSGQILCGVLGGGSLVLLLWAAVMILMEDFVPISLEIKENAVVSSQYKEEYRIDIDEIEEVILVEEMPKLSKRVGSAMDHLLKGSFMDKEYKSCKACVRRLKPPFIKIVMQDGIIYYLNDEEVSDTKAVYDVLAESVE